MNSIANNIQHTSKPKPPIHKKRLCCPVCNFNRLIDADESTKSELIPESKIEPGWIPDYYQKCPVCKSQIGIKKLS